MKKIQVTLFAFAIVVLQTACNRNPVSSPLSKTITATISYTAAPQRTPTTSPPDVIPTEIPQNPPTEFPTSAKTNMPTPTPRATEAGVTVTSTSTSLPCLNEAVFIGDVTIPDNTIFRPGEAFTKTWRVKNTGTCTWGAGYSLIYASGDIMNGEFSNPIQSTSPGGLADVSVDLNAPTRGGEQTGYWQFQNATGETFGVGYNGGGPLWVKIDVTFFNPNPLPTALIIMPDANNGPTPTPISSLQSLPTPVASNPTPTELSATTGCTPQQNDAYVNEMLSLINLARAENGLQPVFLQSQLTAAALKHSIDMACNQNVDHHGSDGSTWYSRVEAEGYANPRSARENIKVGTNVQDSFDWWMNSQIHRENILFPSVTEVGIGYVFVPGSPYGSYFTLLLARR